MKYLKKISIYKMVVRLIIAVTTCLMVFPLLFLASYSMKDSTSIYEMPPKLLPTPAKSVTIILDYSKFEGEDSETLKDKILQDTALTMYVTVSELNKESLGEIKLIGTMGDKNIFYQRAHATQLRLEQDYGVYKNVSVMDRQRLFYDEKYKKSADAIGYQYNVSGIDKEFKTELLGKNDLNNIIMTELLDESYDRGLHGDFKGTAVTENTLLWLENFKYYAKIPSYMFKDIPIVSQYSFFAFVFNTLLLMGWAFLTQVGICSLTAYSLSRLFSRKMSKILMLYFLGTMMIPFMCILIPQALFLAKIGAKNNYGVMLLPYLYPAATFIILFKGFFDRLPQDLLDAAKVDGATEMYIYSRLVMPLSKSITAVVGLNVILGAWNEFFWLNFAANSTKLWTINVALYNIAASPNIDTNAIMGLSLITILPVIILSLIFSNKIKESLVGAALKG
jgi:ABC-type glycerol-3-phosphate transport system permease component